MSKQNLAVILVLVVVIAAAGFYFWQGRGSASAKPVAAPTPVAKAVPAATPLAVPAPSAAQNDNQGQPPVKVIDLPSFTPLTAPPGPSFLNAAVASDLKVNFFYNNEIRTGTNVFYYPGNTVADKRNDRYQLLPDKLNPVKYGPEGHDIFWSQESHSYQGIPVAITNPKASYTLEYVALKISNPQMVERLYVEMGIDYAADNDGDAMEKEKAAARHPSFWRSWFTPSVVYACGPGIYLREVGKSDLVLQIEEAGVTWYKLQKPIVLANLNLNYCDNVDQLKAKAKQQQEEERAKRAKRAQAAKDGKKNQQEADEETEDEEDYYDELMYCTSIDDLSKGHLRLHISYVPSGISGPLQIQAVNFIFRDAGGQYVQPKMGNNFEHYYRGFLADPACLKGPDLKQCVPD